MAQPEVFYHISIILDESNYPSGPPPYNGSTEPKNSKNTSQAMHNHLTFFILLKTMMMILMLDTDPILKIGIVTTPKLSPNFSAPQFHPSIRSLPHLRLPKRFEIIWPSGILLLMVPMSNS